MPGTDIVESADDVKTWLRLVERITGRKPIIYTSKGFWDAHMTDKFGEYPLWVAEYNKPDPSHLPRGWKTWTFWQYSEKGHVAGIEGEVDTTLFNGSYDNLKAFANR